MANAAIEIMGIAREPRAFGKLLHCKKSREGEHVSFLVAPDWAIQNSFEGELVAFEKELTRFVVFMTQCEDPGFVDDHWLVVEARFVALERTGLGLDRNDLGICGERDVSE